MVDTLKFVNSITSGTTRLDLNDVTTFKTLADGTSFPPPELRVSRSSSMITDGEYISASSFSNRFCSISLELNAATPDAIATATHNLILELMRPRNVLIWKPDGATSPVYFHTYQASPRTIEDILRMKKRITIEIEASPFSYGARTSFGTFTIDNDPAGTTNPTYFDLSASAVPGDYKTPLFLKFPSSMAAGGRRTTAVAVRAGGEPSGAPLTLQAESLTLAANTAVQANSSAWSGAGSNRVRASSLSTSFVVRATSSALYPATPSVDVRGTYRVWLRGAQTVGSDGTRGRLEWSGDGVNWIQGREEIFPANNSTVTRWWDLGLVQFPIGRMFHTDGLSGADLPVTGLYFRLALARDSGGTGNFDFDVFKFMPADQSTLYAEWPSQAGSTDFILDSMTPAAYGRDSSGNQMSGEIVGLHGGPPFVYPGVKNRIHVLRDVGGTATAGDIIPGTYSVEAFGWPAFVRERTA